MNLTKLALKRPVSVILIILSLAVFGLAPYRALRCS